MITQHGMVHTYIKWGVTVIVVVILLVPVYFLFSLRLTLFTNSDTIFACDSTVDPKRPETSGTGNPEAPIRRLGDYYDPGTKTYHCPGGGGSNATECGGSGGDGGLPKNRKPPPPPSPSVTGTIKGFAVSATDVDKISTCEKLAAYKAEGGHFLSPTEFYFELYGPYIQSDAAGATAIGMAPYSYNAVASYPNVESPNTDYATHIYCSKNVTETSWKSGNYFSLKANDTVILNVGFLNPPLPWFQITGGGDTYANKLYSRMPLQNTLTMFFDKTAAPLEPGILSVKSEAMLSNEEYLYGFDRISTKNWNTSNGMMDKDWYAFYTARLAQATQLPYIDGGSKPTWSTPAPEESTYKVYTTENNMDQDLTISHQWIVGNNEKIIIIVGGDLKINEKVNIANDDTGFVAFIVKKNIIIDPTVGSTFNSVNPVVEGMYIAGQTLKTGLSTDASTVRFVGKGMFNAKNILLQRTLKTDNKDYAADLFFYNPAFLVTMPDILKDLSYTWQEVAP